MLPKNAQNSFYRISNDDVLQRMIGKEACEIIPNIKIESYCTITWLYIVREKIRSTKNYNEGRIKEKENIVSRRIFWLTRECYNCSSLNIFGAAY